MSPTDETNENKLLYVCIGGDEVDKPIENEFQDNDLFQYLKFFKSVQLQNAHISEKNIRDGSLQLKRYSEYKLLSALRLMGCKHHYAFEIAASIFSKLEKLKHEIEPIYVPLKSDSLRAVLQDGSTINITQSQFLKVVKASFDDIIKSLEYNPLLDFVMACNVIDKQQSLTILLGGTSGCGKSTLASLLASRIGISTVVSTDHIRHMLRNFISEEDKPELYASTYHAGEVLKFTEEEQNTLTYDQKILRGYEAQSILLFDKLEHLISHHEQLGESIIIEGVHLKTDLIADLMKRHPTIIPFMIHISNQAKHKERFAIRAKYMTLEPRHNKYIKYFNNIRTISDELCKRAEHYLIPTIDNTNIDRSLSIIHHTVFGSLRKLLTGEKLFNSTDNKATIINEAFLAEKKSAWKSKSMLNVIRKKQEDSTLPPILSEVNELNEDDLETLAEDETEHEQHSNDTPNYLNIPDIDDDQASLTGS